MRNITRIAVVSIVSIVIVLTAGDLVSLPAQTASPGKRPFTFEDMMALKDRE